MICKNCGKEIKDVLEYEDGLCPDCWKLTSAELEEQ